MGHGRTLCPSDTVFNVTNTRCTHLIRLIYLRFEGQLRLLSSSPTSRLRPGLSSVNLMTCISQHIHLLSSFTYQKKKKKSCDSSNCLFTDTQLHIHTYWHTNVDNKTHQKLFNVVWTVLAKVLLSNKDPSDRCHFSVSVSVPILVPVEQTLD